MKNTLLLLVFGLFILLNNLSAQVRPAETNSTTNEKTETTETDETVKTEVKPPVGQRMLEAIEVKYTGGLFGFSKSMHGTIKFDTINERMLFFGEDGKEKFSIPYQSMIVVYPSKKKVQSGAGRAVGAIPIPGASIGGMFMKKKKNYLVIQFDDPDVQAKGLANFLVDTGDLLTSAIYSIGENAEMKPRGDAYVCKQDF